MVVAFAFTGEEGGGYGGLLREKKVVDEGKCLGGIRREGIRGERIRRENEEEDEEELRDEGRK